MTRLLVIIYTYLGNQQIHIDTSYHLISPLLLRDGASKRIEITCYQSNLECFL